MRLIDADKLTDGKGIFNDVIHVDFEKGGGYIMVEDLLNILDNQHIAYDVDKVVEQLEDMRSKREEQLRSCADNDMADYLRCKMSAIAEIIEIVKSGGRNEVN